MHKYTLTEVESVVRIMEVKFIDFSIYDLLTGINYEKANFICYNGDSLNALKKVTENVVLKLNKDPNYYIDKMI